ncbi:exported hypothetical protein [Gammaproteobacteria bacterium]
MSSRFLGLLALCVLLLSCPACASAAGSAPLADGTLKQPPGVSLIPDHFLHRWDPVTLFFDTPAGPSAPGPEDHPERWASFSPAHPGAWQWLDVRTLQFRPAEPWPALTRFDWRMAHRGVERHYPLATLMEAPTDTLPRANNEEDADPVEAITLTFAEPLDPSALARMVRIELRPLPGLDANQSRWLQAADFDIKTMERHARADPASYVLQLHEPLAAGQRVLVHLQLSLDDQEGRSFKTIPFSTSQPFRIAEVGCTYGHKYPMTPAGVHYTPEQTLTCDAEYRRVRLRFTTRPRPVSVPEARNLVRFEPAVDDLTFATENEDLAIRGRFKPNVLYHLTLLPTPLQDVKGRTLEMPEGSDLYFYFTPQPAPRPPRPADPSPARSPQSVPRRVLPPWSGSNR